MTKIAKALHLIGLAMFLGSILGHITLGLIPSVADDPTALLFARQAIEIATWALTIPGLALLVATGLFMTLRGRLGVFRIRWLTLHQAIALLIVLNAAIVLVPVGAELLATAGSVADRAAGRDAMASAETREAAFGAVNVLLALATVFLAVLKPRFGQPDR